MIVACRDDTASDSATSHSTGTSDAASTSSAATSAADATTRATTEEGASSSSDSTTGGSRCIEIVGDPKPAQKIAFVVDTSASMHDPVHTGMGAPVDPWAAMTSAITAIVECLGDDPEARAEFALILMPGPVGGDLCGRSDALDLAGWVSGTEILDRLAQVVPQGGRAMRRALEDLPTDADLVVVLSHGAPGCGDDVDPEVFDDTIATTIVATDASVVVSHVALASGVAPATADTEPDGIDPYDALLAISQAIGTEQWCTYPLPAFSAQSACSNLTECLYGDRVDPCVKLVPPHGEVDDIHMWIGGDPVPHVERCGDEDGWAYRGDFFGSDDWMLSLCTVALCRRSFAEGIRIEYACGP